jgi:hypothetical protein
MFVETVLPREEKLPKITAENRRNHAMLLTTRIDEQLSLFLILHYLGKRGYQKVTTENRWNQSIFLTSWINDQLSMFLKPVLLREEKLLKGRSGKPVEPFNASDVQDRRSTIDVLELALPREEKLPKGHSRKPVESINASDIQDRRPTVVVLELVLPREEGHTKVTAKNGRNRSMLLP